MRILLIAHGLPPDATGGVEIYTEGLARALARDPRDQIAVLAREADPARPEYAVRRTANAKRGDDGGLEVYRLNRTYRDSRSFEASYRNPKVRAAVAALLDELRPDVAHIQHLTHLSSDIVLELAQRGVPQLMTLHDFWLSCGRGQLLDLDHRRCAGPSTPGCAACLGLTTVGAAGFGAAGALRPLGSALPAPLRELGQRTMRRALAALPPRQRSAERAISRRQAHVRSVLERIDLFISPSQTVLEHFVGTGQVVARARIVHCPHGHDARPYRGLQRSEGDRLRIGFVGSLMVSKAPHLLLEAFAGLPTGAASVHLYGEVVPYHGDHSYAARLRPLLRQPGVHHLGALPHDQMPAALMELDVLVVPSIWLENAPLVISEAMLAGVPVLASNIGGMAEMVHHERDGLLFAPGDARALQAALRRLLDEPRLLQRLRSGIEPVKTIDAHADELRSRYVDLGAERTHAHSSALGAGDDGRLVAVIVNYGTPEQTLRAARSVQASDVDGLIVVDNGALDAARLTRELPRADVVVSGTNLGFTGGANLGLHAALRRGAERLLLVNSDATLEPDCVEALTRALDQPNAGIVGPALLDASDHDRIESIGLRFNPLSGRMRMLGFGDSYRALDDRRPRVVDALSGCVLLLRRELLDTVGLFEDDFFFSFEDLDLCLRARRAGFCCVCAPEARVLHAGSATIGRGSPDRLYYAARNHLLLGSRNANGGLAPLRQAAIAGANLAGALAANLDGVGPWTRVGVTLQGFVDHWRGRYGQR